MNSVSAEEFQRMVQGHKDYSTLEAGKNMYFKSLFEFKKDFEY